MYGSVGAQIRPTYSSGVVTPYPIEYYPRGPPETFNLSRGAYETLLRFLVTRVPNVRFVKGTVSGVTVSSEDPKKLDGVAYRIGQDTKETKEEKAELVIGKLRLHWSALAYMAYECAQTAAVRPLAA